MYNGTMYLVRGISGAGKSTFAKGIWSDNIIFEADKFFINENGDYKFDATKLKDAHAWCQSEVENLMKYQIENVPIGFGEVVIANTFTQEWEMEPYMKLAEKYNYRIFSLVIENRHGNKNQHNVPDETIKKMVDRFEVKLT
jgi:predicted kinase